MKKILSVLASAAILATAVQLPSNAAPKTNTIGPQISFGNGLTLFGAKAKFGVADSISVRPELAFGSVGGVSIIGYGAALTYDFDLSSSQSSTTQFEPYAGIGFLGISASGNGGSGSTSSAFIDLGTDIGLGGNLNLNADLKISLGGGGGTLFGIGAGFKF
jgi:hypothetical protein